MKVVISDADGLWQGRKGLTFFKPLMELFTTLTSKGTSKTFYWKWWAVMHEAGGDKDAALDCRLKECRGTQGKIFLKNPCNERSDYMAFICLR